jgi:hypothetical protein
MKTPKELAIEYADDTGELSEAIYWRYAHDGFLDGFRAGQKEMLEYAEHVASSGEMTILSPIPNDKRKFCRKGSVVMLEDLERYIKNFEERK